MVVIAAASRLELNWNSLSKSIAAESNEYVQFRNELIIALTVVVVIVGLSSSHALHTR
jgi:hypothetical protein